MASFKINGREAKLAYSNRALFRGQSLPNGLPKFSDFNKPNKAYAAAIAWAWAMLQEPVASSYPSPEDLAEDVGIADIEPLSIAVMDAISEANLGGKNSSKNNSPASPRRSKSKRA